MKKTNKYVFCFVFNADGKVLVIRRAGFMRARPGEWDLPGGSLDDGEAYEDGVLREVREETGLDVSGLELIVREGGEWHGASHEFSYYRAEAEHMDVVLSEEHDRHEWHEPLVAAAMVSYKPHLFGFAEAMKVIPQAK